MPSPVNQIEPPAVDDVRSRLAFWLRNDAARLLWPACCLACGDRGGDGIDLCAACAAALPWNRSACLRCAIPLSRADGDDAQTCGACLQLPDGPALRGKGGALAEVHTACVYAAPVDRLLLRFKFHHDLAAGGLLAQLMAQALVTTPRPDALVAVPLHRARLRQRGYDQALELARPLARALGLPLLTNTLRRVRATVAQSRLDAPQRRRNLHGAFAVLPGMALPAHVALVDDVMTTGATLQAAAMTLRRAGVQRVDAWVCARVP
ncbi:MAG: ComF family protein [Lysobacter sp.]